MSQWASDFPIGARVLFTEEAYDAGLVPKRPRRGRPIPVGGVVVGRSPRHPDLMRVRLDGQKTVSRYHVKFFRLASASSLSSGERTHG